MAPKSPWKNNHTKANAQHAAATGQATTAINYGEAQDEEIEVLRAIYMDDYEDVEIKGAWSKTADRSFKLSLRAFSDQESLAILSVRLTATYPKTLPLLEVSGIELYHDRTQNRIRKIVANRPKQLLGEVMIHAIASEIQEAVEDAVNARQHGTLPSLEDERASADEVAAARAQEVEESEARRLREAQEEEDRVLKQMLDDEVSRREKRKPAKASVVKTSDDVVSFDQPATISDGNDRVQFSSVTLISLLKVERDEQHHLGRPQTDRPFVPLVAVKRSTISKDRDDIIQIESFLEAVRNTRHPGILGLLAYRVDKLDAAKSQVILCSEYADRGTLHDLLEMSQIRPSTARQFTVNILEALDYLHNQGVAHGSLACDAIFLDSKPSMSARLGKLGQSRLHMDSSVLSPKWRAPEGKTDAIASWRKTDIWQLGVVVAQMFLGLHIVDEQPSPEMMLGRLDLSESFEDLLRKAFTQDPKRRVSAFDLLPAEFLRTDAEVLESVRIPPSRGSRRASSSMMSVKRRSRHNSSNIAEPISRYVMDFTELGRLGKGGFGEVVKARNKLDGGVYAVKKVKKSLQLLDQVLSEVMLLNRLNHPYVVRVTLVGRAVAYGIRYFSTWVEDDFSGGMLEDSSVTTEATTDEATEEATSDGPRMDFGFSSTGGLDFVSSSGYPHIEFGDDDSKNEAGTSDEDELNVATTDTSEREDLAVKRSRSGSQKPPSILYIQMEYCERHTLRDLTRKGMTSDESWRYVRQITEGLAHIHSHGIIHRDLKPDNIFIDLASNPKIGDFGLATTSQYPVVDRSATMRGHSGGEMTRSVGTTLYVAPELRSSAGGSYNDKVDMYSLGIMFYEMCQIFSTSMERIRALQQIREKQYELPAAYRPNGEKAAQGKLIICLISHKPGERPSSTELLRSDVLPVKVEDETIRQALSGLTDPRSPYHQKMMSALFAHDSASKSRVKALAWDAKEVSIGDSASRLRYRSVATQTMSAVFRRHGAEETRRDTLFPRSNYYTNANVVQLLDASGNLLQMPYDLTLPHARQLARNTPAVKRSFTFGSAYRDAFTAGAPKVSDDVDFDIAQISLSEDSALDDAETLKVMDEIVCAMPFFSKATSASLQLNHTTILDAILDHCRVPTAHQATVKETLSKLGFHQWTWSKVRAELRKFGLPDTSLDDLQQFDFRDTPDKAFAHLRTLMQTANLRVLAKLEEGLRSLQDILKATSHFALQLRLYITPLGSVNARLYEGGMLFQCVLERKSNRAVIAAGGRYDTLLHAHRPMTATKSCEGAVGVSIGLDSIVAHMAKSRGDGGKKAFLKDPVPFEALPRRCEVVVEAGPTEGSTAAGLRLLASLWANDLSAELATSSRTAAAASSDHSFVVAVRHEASNSVRVRNTATESDEVDVPITTLVGYLQQELREREASKTRPPSFVRQASSHHDNDRRGNVQVLMSQHRSKKTNKYHIVEAAQQRWAEAVEEWKDAPILAVETGDSVLDSIRETRLGDVESWRRAVQACQLNERQYLGQVQEILDSWRKKWADEGGPREACIFNFRTGNCMYYDVGL
ncbi:eukaryotic translation initiation factor 2-alpha kinase [Friedmanniomyces endolithicus]|nr:eukaryotic translation initiation factor 2-alpha kinase [Friedmanniomyces endolithicus]KAK0803767.1 eukaryotic translation initiation factor 2-alpha kinase [Friedmanniomyces endolithicus]KAK0810076.1 eukaryotic translation initiation factor 2-alpha kinase [Friedmanniomyces endolithicus]